MIVETRRKLSPIAACLLLLTVTSAVEAIENCSAKIRGRDGSVLARFRGNAAEVSWKDASGHFREIDKDHCASDSTQRTACVLNPLGSGDRPVPPADCLLHLRHADGAECTTYIRRCSPGLRSLPDCLRYDAEANSIIVEGCNLIVRDGTGDTDGETNGLGNVIIGYESPTPSSDAGHRGSHNLILGIENQALSYGSIVSGVSNSAMAPHSAVVGGTDGNATGIQAVVLGGQRGIAEGTRAVAVGGDENAATGVHSVTLGGGGNTAAGEGAVVAGGSTNTALGTAALAGGGVSNQAVSFLSVAIGGRYNEAGDAGSGQLAPATFGGETNKATGPSAVVVGGGQPLRG